MKAWQALNRQIVDCERCPRLREHCRETARRKRRAFSDWDYWGLPVPNFGDPAGRLLLVGLAPAAHGANRTGRMFTGDRSGEWLFRALHRAGFANQPTAIARDDGLELIDCAITAVCHCAPPGNKPTREELLNCLGWLRETLDQISPIVTIALGQIAWQASIKEFFDRGWLSGKRPRFAHLAEVEIPQRGWLLGSYHPSQQNTFTGRLTEPMFDQVFELARRRLESEPAG